MNETHSIKPFIFYSNKLNFKSQETRSGKKYYIEGYISTGDIDLVNDIVTKSCMDNMMNQFDGRSIKLDFEHEAFRGESVFDTEAAKTRIPLGKACGKERDQKGVKVKWELNPTWKKFDSKGDVVMNFKDIWQNVESGFYDAFSIAYIPTKTQTIERQGKTFRMLDNLQLLNVALTGNPVNPAATMSAVMAKSLDFMKQNEEEINMVEVEIKDFEELNTAMEDFKSKYKRRWRGRDGKYHYEYADGAKKPSSGSKKEVTHEEAVSIIKQVTSGNSAHSERVMEQMSDNELRAAQSVAKENLDSDSKVRRDMSKEAITRISKELSSRKESSGKENIPDLSNAGIDKIENTARSLSEQGMSTIKIRDKLVYNGATPEEANAVLEEVRGERVYYERNKETHESVAKVQKVNKKDIENNKSNQRCKSMTDDQLTAEQKAAEEKLKAETEAKAESEAKAKEDAEKEDAKKEDDDKADSETKSIGMTELKSAMAEMKSEIATIKKENADLKAIVEKAQHKGLGGQKKETKGNESATAGPLDLI